MDISVIVPVFNTPTESLLRCFESIKFPKDILWEAIVVDDGSEKTTAEFCSVYAKGHEGFHYFRQDNKGVSAARNAGIALAEGRYITFLDSDDELIGEVLEKCVINSDYDLVCFDHILNENGRIRQWKIIDTHERIVEDKRALLEASYKNRMNSACTKLFSRKLIQEANLRFDESMVIAEDAVFVLGILVKAEKVCYIPKAIYRYNHSFENGKVRLIRFPQKAFNNVFRLYSKRIELLGELQEENQLSLKQAGDMRLNASAHFVEEVFNSFGTILTQTNAYVHKMEIDQAINIIWEDHRKLFPFKTKMKCCLLRFDIKWMIFLSTYIKKFIIS